MPALHGFRHMMEAYSHELGLQKQLNNRSENYVKTIRVLSVIFLFELFKKGIISLSIRKYLVR